METKQTIFEKVDPEIGDLLVTRRDAIRKGASVSSAVAAGLAIASVPAAIAVLAKDVFGQVPANIVAVLNFALTLEYLEDEFYRTGLAAPVLIPAADRAIFAQISKHEVAHVALLKSVLGSQAVAKPTFDYTAGNGTGAGPFVGVFTVYSTFQAIAQAFEDTGVRAYKGQAGAVAGDDNILTTALQIHSVEARHAAEVRRLRGEKGWITGSSTTLPAAAAAVYAGEDNVTHLGVTPPGSTNAVTEAFDEPLTMSQVLAIVDPFIV